MPRNLEQQTKSPFPYGHVIITFIVAFIIGFFLEKNVLTHLPNRIGEKHESGYAFISPLLECDGGEASQKGLIPFDTKIEEFINKKINDKTISDAAVYYRDLRNGPWFGVNEGEDFIPASLMKVPLMLSVYRFAEKEPGILDALITYEQEYPAPSNISQLIPPQERLELGKQYSLENLVERSIIYSDNQAAVLLLNYLGPERIHEIFMRIGVEDISQKTESLLSVKAYSTFFRILYNSSYLNRYMSERALDILSKTQFKDGIKAGVPENIVVSHKFGESGVRGIAQQLHDCGIVYHPLRPYLLCVMTRGTDINTLTQTIKDLSSLIWNEVDSQLSQEKIPSAI